MDDAATHTADIQLLGAWLGFITALMTIVWGISTVRSRKRREELDEHNRKQDKAIDEAQQNIAYLRKRGQSLLAFSRRLVDILDNNKIPHPDPPEDFYTDDTFIPDPRKRSL